MAVRSSASRSRPRPACKKVGRTLRPRRRHCLPRPAPTFFDSARGGVCGVDAAGNELDLEIKLPLEGQLAKRILERCKNHTDQCNEIPHRVRPSALFAARATFHMIAIRATSSRQGPYQSKGTRCARAGLTQRRSGLRYGSSSRIARAATTCCRILASRRAAQVQVSCPHWDMNPKQSSGT